MGDLIMRRTRLSPLALYILFMLAVASPAIAFAGDSFDIWVRADNQIFMNPVIAEYNKLKNAEVKVEPVTPHEVVQKFATAYAAGQAPDALSLDLIFTPQFANAGTLEDITEFVTSLPYFDKLSPAHLSLGKVGDKYFALPISAESSFILYNKKLFREAGLDPEKPLVNWAEFEDAAVRISALGDDIHGFYTSGAAPGWQVFTFTPLIWASGGDVLSKDFTKATLNTPEFKEAMLLYRRLVQKGVIPESSSTDAGANMTTGFMSGKVGMMAAGTFLIGVLNKDYPEIEYGVMPIPGKNGGFASFAGGDNIVFPKGTKKMEEIKRFMEWCFSLEGQTIMAKFGSLPVRADLVEQALAGQDSRYVLPAKLLSNGHTPNSVNYNAAFNSNTGPWITTLGRGIFSDEDIDIVAQEGEEEMQFILDGN
jgi:multiple sugar transport system substrate-binding protein